MQPTSTQYKEAIYANHRKIHPKVVIDFSATVQQTFLGDDIFLLHLTEVKDPANGNLPVGNISANQLHLRLNNQQRLFDPQNTTSPLYGLLKANRRIRPYLGLELPDQSIEWITLGSFWSSDWNIPEGELWVETHGQDRLKLLQRSLYQTGQVVTPPAAIVHVDDYYTDWMQGTLYNLVGDMWGDLKLNLSGA